MEAVVEFSPSTSRSIDPELFLKFLRKQGLTKEFYGFAAISVGKATKAFGEKVLLRDKCLTVNSDDYGNMKVYSKSLN